MEICQFTKTYGTPPTGQAIIIKGFDLKIGKGEFVCLIDHSGCGKSTVLSAVLSMVAGLNEITSGVIVPAGRVPDHVSGRAR